MKNKMGVKVFISKEVIMMNKAFEKKCQDPDSKEYKLLRQIRMDYPAFKVSVRKIKTNPKKNTYSGLTYDYMKNYILFHSKPEEVDAAVAEFNQLLHVSHCQAKSRRYPVIKKWFLAQYPEIANFGALTQDVLNDEAEEEEEMWDDEEAEMEEEEDEKGVA